MATATNTLDGMFDGKTAAEIERSLRAHRGALTKLTCYKETAANAATIMPTEKGCQELEQGQDGNEDDTRSRSRSSNKGQRA